LGVSSGVSSGVPSLLSKSQFRAIIALRLCAVRVSVRDRHKGASVSGECLPTASRLPFDSNGDVGKSRLEKQL